MSELTHIAFFKIQSKKKREGKNPKRKWIAGGAIHTYLHTLNPDEKYSYAYTNNCVLKNMAEFFFCWYDWKANEKYEGREKESMSKVESIAVITLVDWNWAWLLWDVKRWHVIHGVCVSKA